MTGSGRLRRLLATLLVDRANRANRAGDWRRAGRLYAWALMARPDLPRIHVQHGHALKEQGFPHAAVAAYRRAAVLAPETPDPWVQLGHGLVLLERPAPAALAFATALAIEPQRPGLAADHARAVAASLVVPDPEAQRLALLLEAHDLPPSVAGLIDVAFYRGQDTAPTPTDLWGLVDHFGRVGLGALRPLRPEGVFDAAFYRRTYPGTASLDPVRAYRHWLTLGLRQGRSPNRAAWVEALYAVPLRRLDADARRLAEAMLAVEEGRPPDAPAFAWLSAPDLPPLPAVPPMAELRVWRMLAAGLDAAGRPGEARSFREAAKRRWPVGLAPDASTPTEADRHRWTGRTYAEEGGAQAEAGLWPDAIATLAEGMARHPGDADLRHRFAAVADRSIHAGWGEAERLVEAGAGMDVARAHLAHRVRSVVAATADPVPLAGRPIAAVAIVGNADLPQCRFYRIEQKREHLAIAGFDCAFFDERTDVPRFLATITRFQAVIFYRVPAHWPVIEAIRTARALGLVTIYEIDDLLFDPAHYPAPIETYGGEFSAADHRGLALAVPMYAEAMALCDVGLASTEALGAAMRPYLRSGRAFVQPNAFGAAHAAFAALAPPARRAGTVTIFYGSHTKAHKADVQALVEPALAEVVRRHGAGVAVLLIGFVPLTATLQTIGAQVTILDPMPLAEYWALLATADIVVAPLFRSPATDAKSEIKWLEAAMLGLPTIVSRTATAERVIEDGVTGFLCETADDWLAALDRLVGDAVLRQAVGAQAKAEALRRYAPARAADNLRSILGTLSPSPAPRRPRILVVNAFYPPQDFGGATRVVHDNVRDLVTRHGTAFEIEVFATLAVGGEAGRLRTVAHEGVRVTTVSVPADDTRDMVAEDPAMGRLFGEVLDAMPPDLVHFHCVQRLTASVVEAARRRAIPYLITVHDGWWISSHQFLLDAALQPQTYDYGDPLATLRREGRPAFDRLLALSPALGGARAVLAVSEAFAALHAASHVPKAVALPNGVSTLPHAPRVPRAAGPVRLGALGGLYDRKGWPLIETALRAWRGPGAFALLAIDHAMAAGEVRTERWGDVSIEFRGKVPAAEVAALYAEIDVLLAPSLWPESFGLVTREALSCGCWVVASDRGAVGADVIAGVNGFVVDVSTPDALMTVLDHIAADPARFLAPPPPTPLRTAQDQADDLARLYRRILGDPSFI